MNVNGWFFDIYIQGSKNTTLRAESEIKLLKRPLSSADWPKQESFSYHNLVPRLRDQQIDQATKSASWMPWCQ